MNGLIIEHSAKQKVEQYFVKEEKNCAITTLQIMSELFDVPVNEQLFDALTGMNGAGKFGAQCGLVEGILLFLSLWAKQKSFGKDEVQELCNRFAEKFTSEFGSLLCRELRLEGFGENVPPNFCLPLAEKAIQFDIQFIKSL